MRRSSFVTLANVGFACAALHAADATRTIDYTDRNGRFAPQTSVEADKRAPEKNATIQEKRVTLPTVDLSRAAVGDKRAPIETKETREKNVVPKNVQTPETVEQPKSRYDQQRARISTEQTHKPPTVAKYQDSLAAASATNMARFPALDQATRAQINRFVFRKNGGDAVNAPAGAPVVPAAGGSSPIK